MQQKSTKLSSSAWGVKDLALRQSLTLQLEAASFKQLQKKGGCFGGELKLAPLIALDRDWFNVMLA